MHATDTLDLMVVLDGEIVLGLGDGEHHLSAGDFVVQRGTVHRWRVVGDIPCTYAVTMFRADHARPLPVSPLAPRPGQPTPTVGLRRLVTGTGEGGTSAAVGDGTPPVVTEPLGADGPLLADVWQTGGQVVRADQGGDVDGGWALDPVGNGVAFRVVELPLDIAEGGRGWHATHTIDVDFIMAGPVELELPGQSPVRLEPGDVVVQRGTEHLWRPVGERRPRLVSVMIGVD
jgi:quercetin dioxygenase-like cupin family protein